MSEGAGCLPKSPIPGAGGVGGVGGGLGKDHRVLRRFTSRTEEGAGGGGGAGENRRVFKGHVLEGLDTWLWAGQPEAPEGFSSVERSDQMPFVGSSL